MTVCGWGGGEVIPHHQGGEDSSVKLTFDPSCGFPWQLNLSRMIPLAINGPQVPSAGNSQRPIGQMHLIFVWGHQKSPNCGL